jgi:hypothetical protein
MGLTAVILRVSPETERPHIMSSRSNSRSTEQLPRDSSSSFLSVDYCRSEKLECFTNAKCLPLTLLFVLQPM